METRAKPKSTGTGNNMGISPPKYQVAAVQAAPAFLHLDKSVDKAISLIEEAARNGSALIAFPEVIHQ